MSQGKFWVLCISKMPLTKNVMVKILSSEDVPAKGEELSILAQFGSKESARRARKHLGDQRMIDDWKGTRTRSAPKKREKRKK